jgi:hypothetical protein
VSKKVVIRLSKRQLEILIKKIKIVRIKVGLPLFYPVVKEDKLSTKDRLNLVEAVMK